MERGARKRKGRRGEERREERRGEERGERRAERGEEMLWGGYRQRFGKITAVCRKATGSTGKGTGILREGYGEVTDKSLNVE